jgi:large subunit ribosomal protein L9
MKVILRKEHQKLGSAGATVNVKDGYAMNYLIPQGIAVEATPGQIRSLAEIKKQQANKVRREISDSEKLAAELEKVELKIKMKAGEEDRIFGSVTGQTISEALAEKGLIVDKKFIEIEEPIRHLGIFTVNVKFHSNVRGSVKVVVEKEE